MKKTILLLLILLVVSSCSKSNPSAPQPTSTTRYSYSVATLQLHGVQTHFVGTTGVGNSIENINIVFTDSTGPVAFEHDSLILRYSSHTVVNNDRIHNKNSKLLIHLDTIRKLILSLQASADTSVSSGGEYIQSSDTLFFVNLPYQLTDTTLTSTINGNAIFPYLQHFNRYTDYYIMGQGDRVRFLDNILGCADTASFLLTLRH